MTCYVAVKGTFLLYRKFQFWKAQKKHTFTEHMLDKYALEHDNKTKEVLEDIKTFDTSLVSKYVIFI